MIEMEFELKKDESRVGGSYETGYEFIEGKRWTLISKDQEGSAESHYTSRRKALLSIVRRIELLKPSKHFRITLEEIKDEC